jgi:hypothetical protein
LGQAGRGRRRTGLGRLMKMMLVGSPGIVIGMITPASTGSKSRIRMIKAGQTMPAMMAPGMTTGMNQRVGPVTGTYKGL